MSHNNTAVADVGGAVQWDDELTQVDTVVPWTYQAGGIGQREAPRWRDGKASVMALEVEEQRHEDHTSRPGTQ